MASKRQWLELGKARLAPRFHGKPSREDAVVLDTAMGSENAGDEIIMDACSRECDELFGSPLKHVATHYYSPELEGLRSTVKILCGTNILYTAMANQQQWALPRDLGAMRDVCLLGVGMSDIGIDEPIGPYTKTFYRTVLSPALLHSVRDELTRSRLAEIGIGNVLNTSCPTMWSLTNELQASIPKKKTKACITSVTDYCFSPEQDLLMLQILKQEYERVIIWVQGVHDIDPCLNAIIDTNDYELVGPAIGDYNELLSNTDFDYVGTRLHAGIRALNYGHRSLVVIVDNRARQIHADTNLPAIERSAIESGALERWINGREATEIELPTQTIEMWRAQFSGASGERRH